METVAVAEERAPGGTSAWWVFLVMGIGWVIVSLVVLAFDPTSAAAIGWMTAAVLIVAGLDEGFTALTTSGWRWLHAVLGLVLFTLGVGALLDPFQTFGILALFVGWYLVLKGTVDIIISVAGRGEVPLWGLLLASGVAQVLIGMWAVGYPGRSAWLLILWVGLGALLRGITEIVLAFQLRHFVRDTRLVAQPA